MQINKQLAWLATMVSTRTNRDKPHAKTVKLANTHQMTPSSTTLAYFVKKENTKTKPPERLPVRLAKMVSIRTNRIKSLV